MSDQPAANPPTDASIPGFSNALARLSSLAASAGYRIVDITLSPEQTEKEQQLQPQKLPTINFIQSPSQQQQSSPTAPHQQLLSSTSTPQQTAMLSATAALLLQRPVSPIVSTIETHKRTGQEQRDSSVSRRASLKRRSIASLATSSAQSPNVPKRTRLSEPSSSPGGRTSLPSAFWGTVLQDRPAHVHQIPPLIGPSMRSPSPKRQTSQALPSLQSHPRSQQRDVHSRRISNSPTVERGPSTLQRTTTLPSLPTTSFPLEFRSQSPPVALEEATIAPIQRTLSARPSPSSSGLLRHTKNFLSRISPFPSNAPSHHAPQQTQPYLQHQAPSIAQNTQALVSQTLPLPPVQTFTASVGTGPRISASSQSASASGVSQAHVTPPPPSPTVQQQSAPATSYIHRQQQQQQQQTQHHHHSSLTGIARAPPVTVVTPHPPKRGRRPLAQNSAPGTTLFKCTFCTTEFRRKSDKTRHIRVVHEKSRPFSCDLCGKTFGEKSNMLKHRASVHDDVRTFRCAYCNAVFSQRSLCDAHVREVHDKKQAKYFCEQCGLPFSRKVLLHEHYAESHPNLLKAYQDYERASAGAEAVEAAAAAAAAQAAAAAGSGGAGPSTLRGPGPEPGGASGGWVAPGDRPSEMFHQQVEGGDVRAGERNMGAGPMGRNMRYYRATGEQGVGIRPVYKHSAGSSSRDIEHQRSGFHVEEEGSSSAYGLPVRSEWELQRDIFSGSRQIERIDRRGMRVDRVPGTVQHGLTQGHEHVSEQVEQQGFLTATGTDVRQSGREMPTSSAVRSGLPETEPQHDNTHRAQSDRNRWGRRGGQAEPRPGMDELNR